MSAIQDAKVSRIANNKRPIEALVENRLSVAQDKRHNKEVVQAVHSVTRKLVKLLFSQISESGIDNVIRLAEEARVATKAELDVDVNYALRIRNAELQARRLLPLKAIDPELSSVVVELVAVRDGSEEVIASRLIDSWGKLAQALIEGYRVRVQ